MVIQKGLNTQDLYDQISELGVDTQTIRTKAAVGQKQCVVFATEVANQAYQRGIVDAKRGQSHAASS